MKVRIVSLPIKKYQAAGGVTRDCAAELGPGYVYDDILGTCVTEEEYNQRRMMSPSVPSQPQVGNQEYQEQPKFQVNPMLSTGTPRTGPGTGVNPRFAVPPQTTAKSKNVPGETFRKINRTGDALINLGSFGSKLYESGQRMKGINQAVKRGKLLSTPDWQNDRGDYTTNYGYFRPDQYTVTPGMYTNQFYQASPFAEAGGSIGNNTSMIKVKILGKSPVKMKYGGQLGYGFDLGQRNTYSAMSQDSKANPTSGMSEIKSTKPKKLEAEGGELVWWPNGRTFKINGKSHSEGGVKLTDQQVPTNSFIFSKKLKEKNRIIIEGLGRKFKKGGISYAELAIPYQTNDDYSVYESKLSDKTDRTTAGYNIEEKSKMLAKIALLQETAKGMPQGIPAKVVQHYPEFAQYMMPEQPSSQMMMHGGEHFYLPKYQTKGEVTTPGSKDAWAADYDRFAKIFLAPENEELRTTLYNKYKTGRGKGDDVTKEEFIKDMLEAQRQKYAITSSYDPEFLRSEDWDTGGKNTKYLEVTKELGITPQSEKQIQRTQAAYLDLVDLLRTPDFRNKFSDMFIIDPTGVKDESVYEGLPISKAEGWRGNTDISQLMRATKGRITGYKCVDGKLQSQGFDTETDKTAAGFTDYGTAAMDCVKMPPGEKPKETKPSGPKWACAYNPSTKQMEVQQSSVGYSSKEEAMANCSMSKPGKVPYDLLSADKMIMAGQLAFPPEQFPEYMAPTKLQRARPVFFDPARALAANMEAANLVTQAYPRSIPGYSALANQTQMRAIEQASNILGETQNRNVPIAIQADQMGAETASRQSALDAALKNFLHQGMTTRKQAYANEWRQFINKFTKAAAPAFIRAGDLYDINQLSPHFYKSPSSYTTRFKGGAPNFASLSGTSYDASSNVDPYSVFDSYYTKIKKNYADKGQGIDDKQASEIAQRLTADYMKNIRMQSQYGTMAGMGAMPYSPISAQFD